MEPDFFVDMSWFFIITSATTKFGFLYAWILSRHGQVNASSMLIIAELGTPQGIGRVGHGINVTLWCFTMGDLRTLQWRASGLLSITMGVGNSCLRLQGLRVLRQLIVVARLFYVRHRQNLKLVPGVVCLFSYGFLQAITDWVARVTVIVDHAVMVYSYRRENWVGVPVFLCLVHRYFRFSSASSRLHQERPFG